MKDVIEGVFGVILRSSNFQKMFKRCYVKKPNIKRKKISTTKEEGLFDNVTRPRVSFPVVL